MNGNVVGINSSIRTASASEERGRLDRPRLRDPDRRGAADRRPDEQRRDPDPRPPGHLGRRRRRARPAPRSPRAPRSRRSATARPPRTPASPTGDVITKVDDQLITGADSLVATIRSYRPGDEVTVTYIHDGETKTVTLTLDSDADDVQAPDPPDRSSCARDAGGARAPPAAGPSPVSRWGPSCVVQALLELAEPGDRLEAEPLVDADHVRVDLGVVRRQRRDVGPLALEQPQVGDLDRQAEPVAAGVAAHQRAPLVGLARARGPWSRGRCRRPRSPAGVERDGVVLRAALRGRAAPRPRGPSRRRRTPARRRGRRSAPRSSATTISRAQPSSSSSGTGPTQDRSV